MYKVYFHKKVSGDLLGVGKRDLDLIRKVIDEKIAIDPVLFGKNLSNNLKNYKSLRISKYRIIYKVEGNKIFILAVGHRKDIYETIISRLV
jgi:mRNA-degrading endonuclease RelE of RelBE toxin-antitoxin system